jgi:uncharacterized protein YbjT (DUF2867 family)
MRLMVAGATGMVGGLVLRESLARAEVTRVTTVGRRPTGVADPRLREVVHADSADYRTVAEAFQGQDAALFCLGTYTGAVPDAELRRVTVDYAVAFAETLYAGSPGATFALLSGHGADPSGRSRIAFARYKGEAERTLLAVGFPRVYFFRAGYIYPVTPRREPNVGYRILRALYPLLRMVYPNLGVSSEDLARAMVRTVVEGPDTHPGPVLENRDIRSLAEGARSVG